MKQTVSTSRQPDGPYVVPKQFGMRTVLVVTTVFGLIFAAARWSPAPAITLIFYASFVVFISLSQMLVPGAPRLASILAGAVFMPVGVYGISYTPLGSEFVLRVLPRMYVENEWLWLIFIGGFLGYLGGTLLAGVFMLGDLAGRWFRYCRQLLGVDGRREGSP